MTMNDDVREELDLCSQLYDRLTVELAEKDLSDARRRSLILALRSTVRLREKSVQDAESFGLMPPAEAAELRVEFARAALAVCEEQRAAVFGRVHAPEQSVGERCSPAHTYCILRAMTRRLEMEHDRAVAHQTARRKQRFVEVS